MDRRDTVLALLALGAAPLAAEAQQAGKVSRVGVLLGATSESIEPLLRALTEGLRDLGYVEERDFVFERRYADGRLERLPELAAELPTRSSADRAEDGGVTEPAWSQADPAQRLRFGGGGRGRAAGGAAGAGPPAGSSS